MLSGTTDTPYRYDVVAIDPGVNFGMTIVDRKGVRVYNGKLLKQTSSLEYAWYAKSFIEDFVARQSMDLVFVLEGAAYHKTFGQVGLADVRAGFYLGARTFLSPNNIRIVAPMSVRKAVYGDGKHQASDEYPTINHNAADSIALALYGLGT
jgi:hypothetical protein